MAGCRSSDEGLDPQGLGLSAVSLARSMAVVTPRGTEEPLGLGVVVRVTQTEVVLLACPRNGGAEALEEDGERRFRIVLPGERPIPADVIGSDGPCVVLLCPREEHDVRPLEVSPLTPVAGLAGQLVPPPHPPLPSLEPGRAVFANPPAGWSAEPGTGFLAGAPRTSERDERPDDERARAVGGGALLDARGRLLGFATGREGSQPRVSLAAPLVGRMEGTILAAVGADRVRDNDGFLEYTVRVDSVANLPRCEKDEDQEPMLVLEVRIAGELAGKIEVTPGRARVPARICARAPGPVEVLLVALDRSLAKGETREELSRPFVLAGLQRQLPARLELTPLALARHPTAANGPTVVHALLSFEPMDPDLANGARKSPLGAAPLSLGRLWESWVDLPGGNATEFLALEVDEPTPACAFLYRRRLGARLALRAFAPGFDDEVLSLVTADGPPRIAAVAGKLHRGRNLIRVRQVQGEAGTPYELLVTTRAEASDVVSPLFRLVAREAARDGTAFLDSDGFVDEVAQALDALPLGKDRVALAILDELGSRVAPARRLAFLLLERHFPPKRTVLEERLAQGAGGAPDAGLILAEMDPRDQKLWPLLRRVARDPDPYVRARALRVAARSEDPSFAEELASSLEGDPAPIVERAVAGARIAAARKRAEVEAKAPR